MISVRVTFFAVARDLAGVREMTLSLPDGATAGSILDELVLRIPALGPLKRNFRVAVNDEYVAGTNVLHDSDEVALIPPVSGG